LALVGIIANPASGRDIRRLVAHGSVFDNYEKIRIVKRIVLGLQATGVDRVVFMQDYFCIGRTAVEDLHVDLEVSYLDMLVRGDQQDSLDAAARMAAWGRAASSPWGRRHQPRGGEGVRRRAADARVHRNQQRLPFHAGGDGGGLAAGLVARGSVPLEAATRRTRRLDILRDGEEIDLALIDAVVYDERFAGSRAIWEMSKVRAIVLSRAVPGSIGLSSVGAGLHCPELGPDQGVYLEVGPSPVRVNAPIAPGMVEPIDIAGYRRLEIGDAVEVTATPSMLALDGEREIYIPADGRVSIRLSDRGPRVVDVGRTLAEAARLNALTGGTLDPPTDHRCPLLEKGVCSTPCAACVTGR